MDKTTGELDKILEKNKNIQKFIIDNETEFIKLSFHEYLSKIIEEKSVIKSQLIDAAHIERNYGYEIINGKKNPSRDYVLRFCFALRLSLMETNRLLKIAGHNELYSRNKRDCIIIDAINKKRV